MKLSDEEFNPAELDVDYDNDQSFKRYTGEIPKTGTILRERVTKAWWTSSADGDSMMKLLVVAEQNTGALKAFNDLPTWESLTFKPTAAFRYMPFLEHFGLTLQDIKRKMIVSDTDDNIGTPIESIGGLEVGSDDFLCRIVIKRDRYEGQWQSKIDRDGWMSFDEADDVDDDVEDDDVDDEEEEAPPARSRRAAAKPRAARRPEPEPEEDDDEDLEEDLEEDLDDEDEEEEAPPARSRRAPARATATKAPARTRAAANGAKGKTRTRTAARAGAKDDPPF
jgi:hypothetical protein